MRASQKVMAACIFSGQCANYGCLPLYHYETILNVMELSFLYIYMTSIFILLSTLLYSSGFHYYLVICICALLLLLIMYWLEITGINSEFYSLFFPSINCPDLLTKPTLIQSSCSCKYPFMLFSLMIKKKVMEEEKVW
jgi:hypothetical protein